MSGQTRPGAVFLDLETGRDVAFVNVGTWDKPGHDAEISPDGTRALVMSRGGSSSAFGWYGTIDLTTSPPTLLHTLSSANTTVTGARILPGQRKFVITPDSRWAVAADEKVVSGLTRPGVLFIDLETGRDAAFVMTGTWDKPPSEIKVSPDGTRALVLSRGGSSSAFGWYATIDLTTPSPTLLYTLSSANTTVTGARILPGTRDFQFTPDSRFAIAPDEKVVNGSTQPGLLFIDMATGRDSAFVAAGSWDKPPAEVKVSPDGARALAMSRGGSSSAFGWYATINLTTPAPTLLYTLSSANTTVTGARILPGLRSFVITPDSTRAVAADEKVVSGLTRPGLLFIDLATGRDAAFVLTGTWDKPPAEVKVTPDGARAVALSRGGTSSAFGWYATVDLTVSPPLLLRTVDSSNTTVTGARILPGKRTFVFTPDSTRLIAPDEKVVSGLTRPGLLFIDLATGRDSAFVMIGTWDKPPALVEPSADGTRALAINQGNTSSAYGYYATVNLTTTPPVLLRLVDRANSLTGMSGIIREIELMPPPTGTDADNDGVLDANDNCKTTSNPGQTDTDGDGIGDACDDSDDDGVLDVTDNCIAVANPGQGDFDADGTGDACDDTDGDGVVDGADNCGLVPNPGQGDFDFDGAGDACDDSDGDGWLDASDNCRATANAGQADFDGDGAGDACDDADGDAVLDATDNCRSTANPGQADFDGDGAGDACDDADGDGWVDAVDNCRLAANAAQADFDGDGSGDACDDADGDLVVDALDTCLEVFNPDQADFDADGVGDACDDADGDGWLDAQDNCRTVANFWQTDFDLDGAGDACDDSDGDAVVDALDNCVAVFNPDQADFDADGRGDACDDGDGDGLVDALDNCPATENPAQEDLDLDGRGDVCDDDDDGDGVADTGDNCPIVANANQADADYDGAGDACDTHFDTDSVADVIEQVATDLVDVIKSIDKLPGANGLLAKIGNIVSIVNGATDQHEAGTISTAQYHAQLDAALAQLGALSNQIEAKATMNKPQIPEAEALQLRVGVSLLDTLIHLLRG